jgi:hypothetical protein
MAFASLEGLPDLRNDFGFGQVCATLANVHRQEGQSPFSAADFMPSLRTAGANTAQEQQALPDPETHSRLIAALLGKKG